LTGVIHVYDIPSHQLLRSISSFKDKGLSITHLATLLKPPDLIGHISLNLGNVGGSVDAIPVKPILPFHRMRDVKSRDAHEVSMLLPIQNMVSLAHEETFLLTSTLHRPLQKAP
jgi:pre-rRNA-processing protein IPI3